MAMTYTLASQLSDDLSNLLQIRADNANQSRRTEEQAQLTLQRQQIEDDLRRKQGTLLTFERWLVWKAKFDEAMKGVDIDIKPRKTISNGNKLTGRQVFERGLGQEESDDEEDIV